MGLVVSPERLTEAYRNVPWIEGVSEGESSPACEIIIPPNDQDCGQAAEWTARIKCCGTMVIACDQCIQLLFASSAVLECLACGHGLGTFEELFTCTRL